MLLTPPSVTNCDTFSDPSALELDVLYGRLGDFVVWLMAMLVVDVAYRPMRILQNLSHTAAFFAMIDMLVHVVFFSPFAAFYDFINAMTFLLAV